MAPDLAPPEEPLPSGGGAGGPLPPAVVYAPCRLCGGPLPVEQDGKVLVPVRFRHAVQHEVCPGEGPAGEGPSVRWYSASIVVRSHDEPPSGLDLGDLHRGLLLARATSVAEAPSLAEAMPLLEAPLRARWTQLVDNAGMAE